METCFVCVTFYERCVNAAMLLVNLRLKQISPRKQTRPTHPATGASVQAAIHDNKCVEGFVTIHREALIGTISAFLAQISKLI